MHAQVILPVLDWSIIRTETPRWGLFELERISVIDNREEDMQCIYLSKDVKFPARK